MIKVAIRNVTLTAFAVAIGLCPQNCVVGQEEKSEGLWIGVLAADGGVVPIALSSDEIWQMPWPAPGFEGEVPDAPPEEVPTRWYVAGQRPESNLVRVDDMALVNTYCGRRWVQVTDRDKELPRRESSPVRIVGMVLSQPLDLVQEEQIPGIQEYRERNRLVSNRAKGEGALESTALGYFRLGQQLIGVFYQLGYEGEVYEVHEVGEGGRGRVVRYHGGGC